ncbi:positive regulation of sphingomyelin catabolic process, partial [Pristimantis euphronides]
MLLRFYMDMISDDLSIDSQNSSEESLLELEDASGSEITSEMLLRFYMDMISDDLSIDSQNSSEESSLELEDASGSEITSEMLLRFYMDMISDDLSIDSQNSSEESSLELEDASGSEITSEMLLRLYMAMMSDDLFIDSHGSVGSHESSSRQSFNCSASKICVERRGKEACSTRQISVENFTFFKMLGTGGFGRVYLARENISKENVAVKVVRKNHLTIKKDNSYVVEHDVLQLSSQSPHLVHGLAAFQTENYIYFVMELASRGNLHNFINMHYPFDAASLQFMTASLICGIQFLHRNGIIHRDLKPLNILVTDEGRLKITDFGLAITGVYDTTKEDWGGTPGYAAPEMVNNQRYGPGVDYFSLGATLYYMTTKGDAFPGKNMKQYKYFLTIIEPEYPLFLTHNTVDLLEQLLCIDPTKRLGVNGDIKKQPFFSEVNWEDIEAGITEPPATMSAIPTELDVSQPLDFYYQIGEEADKAENMFQKFSFVCPKWSNHYPP